MTDFIETPIRKTKIKKQKREDIDVDKEKFNKTKMEHKASIAKIKATRAELKREIKLHKLLIKQAKIYYKLSKVGGKKNDKK